MTNIETLGTDELIEELQNRCNCMLVALDLKADKDSVYLQASKGSLIEQLGLAQISYENVHS